MGVGTAEFLAGLGLLHSLVYRVARVRLSFHAAAAFRVHDGIGRPDRNIGHRLCVERRASKMKNGIHGQDRLGMLTHARRQRRIVIGIHV